MTSSRPEIGRLRPSSFRFDLLDRYGPRTTESVTDANCHRRNGVRDVMLSSNGNTKSIVRYSGP
jgi:hypothetical protein